MYYVSKMNKTGKKADAIYITEVAYRDIDRYNKVPILWDTAGMPLSLCLWRSYA